MPPKNVIVFYTDQLRADFLGCFGNEIARTPNIDAIASAGVRYSNHYASNTVCMPSRASFYTGQTVPAHRLLDNGVPLAEHHVTLPEAFRRAGYRTASVGKLHFQPHLDFEGSQYWENRTRWENGEIPDDWHGPYYGFEYIDLAIAHGEVAFAHYGNWRKKNFPDLKTGPDNAIGDEKHPEFGCWRSAIPLEAHHSTWVADRSIAFLESIGDTPFFLNVSFPDPHHPFTPPEPYGTMFDGIDFPAPHAVDGENDTKPLPYRRAMTGTPFPNDGGARYRPELKDAYRQIVAHTHGMIALIDDSIGRVLDALKKAGLAENTILVFTSDHGDFMGDHHFLYKGPLPCRSLLNIPLIISDPDGPRGVNGSTCSNIDVMPTLLKACGVEIPDSVQGSPLPAPGEAPERPWAFEAGWSKFTKEYVHFTIYRDDWRISYWPWLDDGELYDLKADPHEHVNLFNDARHAETRDRMLRELLSAVGQAEPAMPPALTFW